MEDSIKEIADFIMKYAVYSDQGELYDAVQKHISYKTCKIVTDDKGKICAVCLWNIDGDEAFVSDLVIREDYRKKDLMRRLLLDGLKSWPIKYMRWNRGYNKDGSMRWPESKRWNVESFLRRKS
jgi:hypothetical protein